jgi:LysM repeat protein
MRTGSAAFLMVLIMIVRVGHSQQSPAKISKEEYIQMFKDIAVEEMNEYGIPASITLAQGVLESGNGNSPLALQANNHFGIKCHKEWTGDTFFMDDDQSNECFRKYGSARDSYDDHSLFLTTRERYYFLFDIDITDYRSWAKGLRQAGYATNPNYPELLIKVIEDFKLYELDKQFKGVLAQNLNTANDSISFRQETDEDDFEPIYLSSTNRKVYRTNGVKYIIARQGDTFEKIAADFEVYTFQVYRNNDLKKKDRITEGQRLYIEPKKNKASSAFHLVKPGETLYGISQQYAVKLKRLCKYNTLAKDAQLFPDQKIKLR